MRWTTLIVVCAALMSCGPSAVLYTDDLFRAAAPEVVDAWSHLSPWHNAQRRALAPGSGWTAIRADLTHADPGTAVLVGVALPAEDRRALAAALPGRRLVFFVPDAEGAPTVTVDRGAAWEALARSVAGSHRPAFVLFPSDGGDDRAKFTQAWNAAGGGPLMAWVWPQAGAIPPGAADVFQLAGPEAASKAAALSPGSALHGPPEMTRPPGVPGRTWRIRREGLGEFLWTTALGNTGGRHFLPLETVPSGR
jgi:hypothetical protein